MNADGDNALNRSITIDGFLISITQNLFEGLRRLRLRKGTRRLWVDAVCINQRDILERSAQVLRMAEIYARASEVPVWLGEIGKDGEDVVQSAILQCFSDEEYDHPKGRHTWQLNNQEEPYDFCALRKATSRKLRSERRVNSFTSGDSLVSARSSVFWDPISGPRRMEPVVDALDSLFNRRYFKRRWILQELYHSSSDRIIVYFGAYSIPMSQFAAVCGASVKDSRSLRRFIVGSKRDNDPTWTGVQHGLRDVERVLRLAQNKEKTNFLEALERSSHLECSDPRDVLFSLVSLEPQFGVTPDYNLSTADVYASFARLLVQKDMWETVLDNLCNQKTSVDEGLQLLPSWVPNFRHGFVRSAYMQGLEMVDSSPTTNDSYAVSHATVNPDYTLQCSFYAIGILNFGLPLHTQSEAQPGDQLRKRTSGFGNWRDQLMRRLRLDSLPDVFELNGARPYDAASMGDIVCSPRRVYTTEEAVIVVLSPADANFDTFRIVQTERGIDLKSLNGQNVSELWHHSALPAESKFNVLIT
jgi:hypothetical protein